MATRTAVVAGTATAVSGRVHHRQAEKYAAQDQQAYAAQQYEAQQQAPQYQQAPPPQAEDETAQLQKLAQLHAQGILTDEEFAASKAKILGI